MVRDAACWCAIAVCSDYSIEVPGGRAAVDGEQAVHIREGGQVFPEVLQSQEPEPHVGRKEGKIEITLEGEGCKLLRWRRLEVCYF